MFQNLKNIFEKVKQKNNSEVEIIEEEIHAVLSLLIEACKVDGIVSDDEIEKRKNDWKPRKTNHNSGSIWKYSQTVGPAYEGAVTQPGAKDETHTYADI